MRVAVCGLSSDWSVERLQVDISRTAIIHPPSQSGVQCLWSACSHHPPPRWESQILQNNSKLCVRLLCMPYEKELGTFPLFLHCITSLINNCFSLLFGTLGRPRRQKSYSTNKKWGPKRGFCTQEGLNKVLLSFNALNNAIREPKDSKKTTKVCLLKAVVFPVVT